MSKREKCRRGQMPFRGPSRLNKTSAILWDLCGNISIPRGSFSANWFLSVYESGTTLGGAWFPQDHRNKLTARQVDSLMTHPGHQLRPQCILMEPTTVRHPGKRRTGPQRTAMSDDRQSVGERLCSPDRIFVCLVRL